MADGTISIYPAEITAQAPTFATESTDLETALSTLQSTLAGLGSPWGADKQGAEFSAAYHPPHDAVIKAVGTLVQGLASIHEGLTAHAANHADADAYSAGKLR
ncbi:WXG100 family type VII secretion target [Kitasatospora sp. NPDC008050]|uniref:WXG100 family type VII secretion target n=1 Tax=Kitasatospora sp. NPDC008050 TaxID=3364021 RepID=UPI0036EEB2C7